MKKYLTITIICLFVITQISFASESEVRWGGPGYDPALKGKNSSRFTARPHFKDGTAIDILVDDKRTVRDVGRINLISSDGIQESSELCSKAMHHIEAPWACGFYKAEIQEMRGSGTIKVFNRSNELLLEDVIDFDAMNSRFGSESNKAQLTMPDKIGMYLSPSQNGYDIPAIVLTVFAGGGCDQVGELQIAKKMKLNQPNIYTKGGRIDILEIQVKGYEFKKATPSADITCIAVILEARAFIELADIMDKQQLQLKIILNNQENVFGLNHYEDVIYLNPITTSEVVSWNPSENMPERSHGLGFMTQPFQKLLAKVRLNGSYALKSDLATRLRNYIHDSGYEPLDEKLQGYSQMNPLEQFIVFVPSEKEVPADFKIIGKVNYHEIVGGDKTIDVGLVKTVVNPFFVRY